MSAAIVGRSNTTQGDFKCCTSFTWIIEAFSVRSLPYRSIPVKVLGSMAVMIELRKESVLQSIKPFFCFSSIPSDRDLPVEIEIASSQGTAICKEQFSRPYDKEFITVDLDNDFIHQNELENFLDNGNLILNVKIGVLLYLDPPTKNLSFGDCFSDFTILIGNKSFGVHKSILARSSSVFHCMLQTTGFVESQTNSLRITNFTEGAFQDFLNFIYCGEINDFDKNAMELLALADMYDLSALKRLCETFLIATLSENFLHANELFQTADRYRCEKLKSEAFLLIKRAFAEHNFEITDKNPQQVQAMIDSLAQLKSHSKSSKESLIHGLEAFPVPDIHMD